MIERDKFGISAPEIWELIGNHEPSPAILSLALAAIAGIIQRTSSDRVHREATEIERKIQQLIDSTASTSQGDTT